MLFQVGKKYVTRGGRVVTVEEVQGSLIRATVHYASGSKARFFAADGRSSGQKRTRLDIVAEYKTPLLQVAVAPVITAELEDLVPQTPVLYSAELESRYPDKRFFAPNFTTKGEVDRFVAKYGHKVVKYLAVREVAA